MSQTATKTREAPNRRTASLPIRSKYDAAQTTGNNRRHWALADALSANAANSPEIRAIIRARARYEMANNSWAKGMALTLAKATIGKGPRLQMNTPNRELNRAAEALCITKPHRAIRGSDKWYKVSETNYTCEYEPVVTSLRTLCSEVWSAFWSEEAIRANKERLTGYCAR